MSAEQKSFYFFADPGHGWLQVSTADSRELDLMDKISPYSYRKGTTVYLEEDCDASLFYDAYVKKFGKPYDVKYNHSNYDSPIRNLTSYKSPNHASV